MKIKINKNLSFCYKERPKIIAEISGNHNGSKKKFLDLIKSAAKNGADLIKIQTYEPVDITLKNKKDKFYIKKGIWKDTHLWDLYQKACTPFNWHAEAFKIARKYGKEIFSSPFSIRGVDLLESLNCNLYKIASFEITDLKLIDYIASKHKPIIMSTGMCNDHEIKNAIKQINKYHNRIIILHCVSSYPTKLADINLQRISHLKKKFNKNLIGLSDHTNSIISSLVSLPYNIVAIEKHYKLNNEEKTTDSVFSITPFEMNKLRSLTEEIFLSQKKNNFISDRSNIILRRSIFAKMNIKKNTPITIHNIDTLRPKIGICASEYFKILNKKIKRNIKKGEPIYKKDLL